MPNHLQKCRRSHPTKGTATCRFNVSHVFPIQEREYHEMQCPDRVLVEMFVQHMVEGDGNEGDEDEAEVLSDDEKKNESGIESSNTSTTEEMKNGPKNVSNDGGVESLNSTLNMSVESAATDATNDSNWDDVSLIRSLESFPI
jgi:hypothetical protein